MHSFELTTFEVYLHLTPHSTHLFDLISSFEVSRYSVCGRLPHLSKLCVHGLNSLKGSLSGTTLTVSMLYAYGNNRY